MRRQLRNPKQTETKWKLATLEALRKKPMTASEIKRDCMPGASIQNTTLRMLELERAGLVVAEQIGEEQWEWRIR